MFLELYDITRPSSIAEALSRISKARKLSATDEHIFSAAFDSSKEAISVCTYPVADWALIGDGGREKLNPICRANSKRVSQI